MEKKKKTRKWKKEEIILACITAVLAIGAVAAACIFLAGSGKEEKKSISFHENEAMRVMDTPVTMAEYMLYSVDVRKQYESSKGTDYYQKTGTNAQGMTETNEDIVKEEIAETIRMVKVLCKAAEPEFGIKLSEDEKQKIKDNADIYYEDLTGNGVDEAFLTKSVTEKYLREQYLSQKVYTKLKETYGTDAGEAVDVGNERQEDTAVSAQASENLINAIADLEKKYDPDYDYTVNINWELMDYYSFTGIKKNLTDEEIQDAVDKLTDSATEMPEETEN